MTYWKHLWRVELVVVICLVGFAVLFTETMHVVGTVFAPGPPSAEGVGLVFVLVLWFGVVPAVLLFGPTYAYLRSRGAVNFAASVAAGAISGAVFALVIRGGSFIAIYAVPSGAIVAAITHFAMKRMR